MNPLKNQIMEGVKFYRSVLEPVSNDDVLTAVYPLRVAQQLTLQERLPNGVCEDCGDKEWIILPKESAMVRESGKPYIECKNCGYHTHL